jgi:hypothetical protein
MRIAVCISGQPRTWRTAKDNILKYFDIGVEVDFFIHTWDTNEYRYINQIDFADRPNEKILPTEKEEIIQAFKPKDIEIEDYKSENFVSLWSTLLYSFMKSVHMKRKYEIENDFRYDIVVKMRFDVNFLQSGFCNFRQKNDKFYIHDVQPLTAFSTTVILPKFPSEFNYNCFNDVFFYGNSMTMDIIAQTYRWYEKLVNENKSINDKGGYVKDAANFYGPGTLLYKHLINWGISPQGFRNIPYYIVRKEMEDAGLNSIKDWEQIKDFSQAWYKNILSKKWFENNEFRKKLMNPNENKTLI